MMKLISLSIADFGNIRERFVTFGEKQTTICGKNGAGKSMIKNAFYWGCGVDAGIKARPIKADGEPDWSLVPHVKICAVNDDGEQVIMERSSKAEVSTLGKITEDSTYIINDYKYSKKDYISEIMRLFKLDSVAYDFLVSPELFFNGTTGDRRDKLLRLLCIQEAKFYGEDVRDALKGHKIEEAITKNKRAIKEQEKTIGLIIAQVDEARTGIPRVVETKEQLEARQKEVELKLRALEQGINSNKAAEIARVKIELNKAEEELAAKKLTDKQEKQNLEQVIASYESSERSLALSLAHSKQERIEARDKYIELMNTDYAGDNVCPTCGHQLPEALVKSYAEKFNIEKAQKMERLKELGVTLSGEIGKKEKDLEQVKSRKAKAIADGETREAESKQYYEQEEARIAEMRKQYDALKTAYETEKEIPEKEYAALTAEHTELIKKMLSIDFAEDRKLRIAELERALDDAKKLYERKLSDYRKLIDARREVGEQLEATVNSVFRYVQWKLSEVNKSGETEDCCRALVNGVDWNASLNSGAKINAIVDCYNVLSARFGVPLWIDNAEQVTEFIPIAGDGQIIKLYAVDKPLEIRGE